MNDRLNINAEIRATHVRLIGPDGSQVGVVPLAQAIRAAQAVELDLVEVAPNANPPVAKVMDYGKHRYAAERAEREQRKRQRSSAQKGIRLRPGIDDHDFGVKAKAARRFLTEGHSVRVQVMFRRRELRRSEIGVALLDRFAEGLFDIGKVESRSPLEGRFATMVIAPTPDTLKAAEAARAKARERGEPEEPADDLDDLDDLDEDTDDDGDDATAAEHVDGVGDEG